MGDEGEEVKYVYEGERATGESVEVTAGEEPKVLTKAVELLGPRSGKGKAVFPSGDVYEGEFADGARSGAGKYVYAAPPPEEGEEPQPPKGTYEGKFKAGSLLEGRCTPAATPTAMFGRESGRCE